MITFEEIRELAFETGVADRSMTNYPEGMADHEGYDCTKEVIAFATAVWKAAEEHHVKTGQDRILGLQAELTLLRGEVQLLRDALITVGREAVS